MFMVNELNLPAAIYKRNRLNIRSVLVPAGIVTSRPLSRHAEDAAPSRSVKGSGYLI
jgi:hypothetical protein